MYSLDIKVIPTQHNDNKIKNGTAQMRCIFYIIKCTPISFIHGRGSVDITEHYYCVEIYAGRFIPQLFWNNLLD